MESDSIKITKLQNRNQWMVWKFQVKILLLDSDLFDVVTGDSKQPQATDKENLNKWIKLDRKAQKIIATAIGQEPLVHILNCVTSHEMWTKLHGIYELKSNTSIHFLQQEFYSFSKDSGDNMANHIAKLQNLVQQLKDMGENISDSMVITKILLTLPREYSNFHTAWESTEEKQRTLANLTTRLMIEESRLSLTDKVEPNGEALVAKYSNKFNKNKKNGRCFKCKEKGHWKNNCPLLNQGSKLKNQNFRKPSDALVCNTTVTVSPSDVDDWYLDSGASDHMTFNKRWLYDYEEYSEPKHVRIGNGETIKAYGRGKIDILVFNNRTWEEKFLSEVLYVPDIKLNLFSQGQTLDKGYELQSNKEQCELIKDGSIVAVGVRTAKLFKMLFKVILPDVTASVDNYSSVTVKKETLRLWHKRLAHQNINQVRSFLKKMNIDFLDEDFTCDDCTIGKQHRSSFPLSLKRSTRCGEIIHSDVCGPMQEASYGGSKYFVLFKDDFSSFRMVYFVKNKSEVSQCLKNFAKLIKKDTDCEMKILRTDNGSEYMNNDLQTWLNENGIRHQKSVPYTPEQNGRAERDMRTIVEASRTMIHSKNLLLKLWAEAVNTTVFILNRTGPSPVVGRTPYELWFNKIPNCDIFKEFGSEVYIHVPKQNRRKWDKKSDIGIFVGYSESSKAFKVWNCNSNKIQVSCDVKFKVLPDEIYVTADSGLKDNSPIMTQIDSPDIKTEDVYEDTNKINGEGIHSLDEAESIKDRLRSRSKTGNLAIEDSFVFIAEFQEPLCYDDAIKSPEKEKWFEAMEEEYEALIKNHTWDLVQLPFDQKTIQNRWVYKVKLQKNGAVDRYKARLVVKGYSQRYGVDFRETFSPVARFSSIRVVLAISAYENLIIKQFDIKTAFLHGDLSEDIYMQQPEGYDDNSGRVCKLLKSLYGLKQASRCWNLKFTTFLHKFGLVPTKADPCIFMYKNGSDKIILALYIDDGLIAANNENLITPLIQYLRNNFEITYGDAEYFLGMEITKLEDGSIFLHQYNYAMKVLMRFNMQDCNPVSTPADSGQIIEQLNLMEPKFPYREAVGSLMYLAVATRPDVAYAVSYVSRFMENPTATDV